MLPQKPVPSSNHRVTGNICMGLHWGVLFGVFCKCGRNFCTSPTPQFLPKNFFEHVFGLFFVKKGGKFAQFWTTIQNFFKTHLASSICHSMINHVFKCVFLTPKNILYTWNIILDEFSSIYECFKNVFFHAIWRR